jgi:hypothetical protein
MIAEADDRFNGCSCVGDSKQTIQELEETLAPMVRLALDKGVGLPEVVRWVEETYAAITDGTAPARREYYVPQITRLLCAQWR